MKHAVSRLIVRDEALAGQISPALPFAEDMADDKVERLVVDVAENLGAIETAVLASDFVGVLRLAADLQGICDRAGLLMLARIAGDLQVCARKADRSSLYAVTERAIRVGDASLAAAIDSACLNC